MLRTRLDHRYGRIPSLVSQFLINQQGFDVGFGEHGPGGAIARRYGLKISSSHPQPDPTRVKTNIYSELGPVESG